MTDYRNYNEFYAELRAYRAESAEYQAQLSAALGAAEIGVNAHWRLLASEVP